MTRTRSPLSYAAVVAAFTLFITACGGEVPTGPGTIPISLSRNKPSANAGAALLACPVDTSASASAVIGRHGGVVSVGRFAMRVPPNAVRTPTLFTFTVPASDFLEVDIHAQGAAHYTFERPVTITLDYARCGTARLSNLDAWNIDPDTKQPIERMHGHSKVGQRLFVFSTEHLSGYALAD